MTEQRGPGGEIDGVVVAVGGVVIIAAAFVRLGAALAALLSGGTVGGGLSDWLIVGGRLARGRPPAEAWGELATGLPAPWLYWTSTAVVLVGAAAAVTLAVTHDSAVRENLIAYLRGWSDGRDDLMSFIAALGLGDDLDEFF